MSSTIGTLKKMMDKRQGEYKSKTDIGAPRDSPFNSNERADIFTSQITEVEGAVSFFPALEDEVFGVEHLLVEPELVDGVLGFGTFNSQHCFRSKDFSFGVGYRHANLDDDVQYSDLAQGDRKKLEFIDDPLQETDEGVLYATNKLPALCADNFFGTKYADEISRSDDGSSEGDCLQQICLESQCLDLNGRDCGAVSESFSPGVPVLASTYDQNSFLLDKMTIQELHKAFRSMFRQETLVTDKQWLKHRILYGLENLFKLDNGSNLMDSDFTSNEGESKTTFLSSNDCSERVFNSHTGVLTNETNIENKLQKAERLADSHMVVGAKLSLRDSEVKEGVTDTPKRLRKPTRRYIEESLEHQSTYHDRKRGISCKTSRDKILNMRSHKQPCKKGIGATPLVGREESFREAIQVPFGVPIPRGLSNRNKFLRHESEDWKDSGLPVSNESNDMESSEVESQEEISEDDCITETGKGRILRKKHKYWTTSEAIKLIEGVSKYGVGRWTEIKKLLFSSSPHRTSVDLKDKWRNLLRASCTKVHRKIEVEQRGKHTSHQMQSILRRVRELAALYPYPRGRKCEDSFSAPTSPQTPAATGDKSMALSTAVRG